MAWACGGPELACGQCMARIMLTGMVPDIWVYRTADRLITKHGKRALNTTDRLIGAALDRHDADRVLLMLRVRLAVQLLQTAPSRLLH